MANVVDPLEQMKEYDKVKLVDAVQKPNKLAQKDDKVTSTICALSEKLKDTLDSDKNKRIRTAIAAIRTTTKEILEPESQEAPEHILLPKQFPDRDYLLAFEVGAGKQLKNMNPEDSIRITFTVGSVVQERSPTALFTTISRQILGKKNTTKGKQLCIHIRDGKTVEEAKKLIEKAEEASEVNQAYLFAFEKGSGEQLENMNPEDSIHITFTVGSVMQKRSPKALFIAISRQILGNLNTTKGKQLCIHIRDGKTVEEAKKLVEKAEEASEVNQAYLFAFEKGKGKGKKLEGMGPRDSDPITFTVGSVVQERSPRALFAAISMQIFEKENPTKGKQLCMHIRDGKTVEEAKNLVVATSDPDIKEDEEFAELSQLNIAEVIAFFRNQEGGPAKLKLYLQIAHKMDEEEANRIVIRTFRALYGNDMRRKEDEYLQWPATMEQPTLTHEIPDSTEDAAICITGTATGADYVLISGAFNGRIRVQEDGTFLVHVPLAIGKKNEIRMMSLDRNNETRSMQMRFNSIQEGEVDDVAELIRLLGDLGSELLQQISEDPGREKFLVDCMEHVLIKKFSRSFSIGKAYIQEQITHTNSVVLKRIITQVLENFMNIETSKLPNVKEGSLMFFQKYCVYRIRKAMATPGMKGINFCNDPGLGKTRNVLAALADQDATIFTPNSVVTTWEAEAKECLHDPDLLVLKDMEGEERKAMLKASKHKRRVSNVQFLQRTEDKERFSLISNEHSVVVHDEAHSRKNEHSEQSRGARLLPRRFVINVTATLAKNPVELRRMLHTVAPEKREFGSDEAFRKAFPMNSKQAAKQLKLIVDQYTIRFRKHEVMEEIDPDLPLEDQLDRLPRKEKVEPDALGKFDMSEKQADAIYDMFVNWPEWHRKYGVYIPKEQIHKKDGLINGEGFAKLHAYRQLINNPAFIGDRISEDAKALQMERTVKKCLDERRKVVIFCRYEAQALKYQELLKQYKPAMYIGQTSKRGNVKDPATKLTQLFSEKKDARGYPIEDPNGEPMSALDYECATFQDTPDRQVLIATYAAGSVGSTFTAGKATIYDDLPSDCKEDIQAEDRTHRIDQEHQTHATVTYYQLQSRYPKKFLERMQTTWIRKAGDGTWEEDRGKNKPIDDNPDNVWLSAFEAFFEQGTYDEVHSENLKNQRVMFHLINDGIGDEDTLNEDDIAFKLLAN